jgi:PhnB protein
MSDIAGVPSIIPVLAVGDIQKAIAFYHHLGFREVFSLPDQSGKLAHAHLRKGDSALFLGRLDVSHYRGHRRAENIRDSRSVDRGIGITLILQVDNLASVYDFVCREKLEVLAEPLDQYYGDRVFFFLDPFGYEWKISQPIPAITPPH